MIEKVTGITMYPVFLKKNNYVPEKISDSVMAKFISNNEFEYDLYSQCLDHYDNLKKLLLE
jgi:hypothetical protein